MNSRNGKTKGRPAQAAVHSGISEAIVRPVVLIAIVILSTALLANSMTKELARDEQMYCTAGALLSKGQMIYRDFAYPSQLPYHPLLLATLYKGLSTTHYLLVGRLVSAFSDILVVILIVLIYRSIFGSYRSSGLWLGLASTALYVFNPFVDYAAGYAWNHNVVILCVVLALWLLVTTDFEKRSRHWRMAIIGVLLTAATCMRITTALVELAFLGAILWIARGSLRNRIRTALPFLAAALVLSIWPLWAIAQAPQAFLLNLVRIPSLYGRWLHEIGMTLGKVALTVNAVLTPGYLILLLLAGGLIWAGLRHRSHLVSQEKRKAVAAALLPLVFLVIAYVPPTMWLQYLAMPVPFIVIAFAYPLLALRRLMEAPQGRGWYKGVCCALGAASVLSVLVFPAVLSRTIFALVPEKWEPTRLHRMSRDLTRQVQEPRLVLTLGPLYALEAGCEIYPELSSGSIIYRIADRMTPQERLVTHTVGPQTLEGMVKERPPAAVIVGVEPSHFATLEEPLRRLVPSDWRREDADPLQVYLRP